MRGMGIDGMAAHSAGQGGEQSGKSGGRLRERCGMYLNPQQSPLSPQLSPDLGQALLENPDRPVQRIDERLVIGHDAKTDQGLVNGKRDRCEQR